MKATRETFGETLKVVGAEHPHVVVLDADLAKSTKSELFGKSFPDRFFECGIAEGNMVGIAAGLALAGKRPFACSFGCFVTGRFEQIRMSVAYNQAAVVLVGTHAGVAIGEDGHSQMALEDIGLMRLLPTMHIFQPTDAIDTPQIVRYLAQEKFPAYLRLTRQKVSDVLPNDYVFTPFQGYVHPDTAPPTEAKLLLFATGGPTEAALNAIRSLRDNQIPICGIIINALWPLDMQWLTHLLSPNIQGIVTVEDHYVCGGLGTLLAEQLPIPKPVLRIGVEKFGQSGSPDALIRHYGLNTESIVNKILAYQKSLNTRSRWQFK